MCIRDRDETAREQQFDEWMKRYPRIVEMATEIGGGGGCDAHEEFEFALDLILCLLYTSPSPRDRTRSRMPSSA